MNRRWNATMLRAIVSWKSCIMLHSRWLCMAYYSLAFRYNRIIRYWFNTNDAKLRISIGSQNKRFLREKFHRGCTYDLLTSTFLVEPKSSGHHCCASDDCSCDKSNFLKAEIHLTVAYLFYFCRWSWAPQEKGDSICFLLFKKNLFQSNW